MFDFSGLYCSAANVASRMARRYRLAVPRVGVEFSL